MQIGILGTFEVRTDDGAVADVPGARLRALLTALALEPGRVVSKTALIDWIWGEQPPADRYLSEQLPEVIPEGAEWHAVVPGIVAWLESGTETARSARRELHGNRR